MANTGPMGGTDQLASLDVLGRAWGSITLRPYVFGFLAIYLTAAAAAWGWRRALTFTLWAGSLAFGAEWTSTRVGFPFGLYHYTGVRVGQELSLANVPLSDPLSFTFLAYASLGVAGQLHRVPGVASANPPIARGPWARLRLAGLAGLLMMWLDVVIDPLAVRGDRWFLGRIFYYPDGGAYFGVPLTNFVGWWIVGAIGGGGYLALAGGVEERRPGPGVAAYYDA